MVDQVTQGILSPFLQRARVNASRPWLKGRVLDIGCGSGALAAWQSENDYVGFDPDAQSLANARKNRPRHQFVDYIPSEEKFDTVVALAVLEHLPKPEEELRKWSSCLAPKGRIVLTTPHRAFRSVHDFGAKLGFFSSGAADEHEEMFNKESLYRLAEQCSLKPVKYEQFLCGANQLFIMEQA